MKKIENKQIVMGGGFGSCPEPEEPKEEPKPEPKPEDKE
jgi:hypothetical protein